MRHLVKRSFSLAGHRTSVALEPAFWAVLEGAARREGVALAAFVARIDAGRADSAVPLASALRVHALAHALGADPPAGGAGVPGGPRAGEVFGRALPGRPVGESDAG